MNIFNITNKNIFFYIIILIAICAYISRFDIKLNIIVGIIIVVIIVYYREQYIEINKLNKQVILEDKINLLRPKNENILKHEEMINFLYSIQEIYKYNPGSYEEMINNLDNFFDSYAEIQINNLVASTNFNDMKIFKRNALNSLHAILLNITPATHGAYAEKLNESLNKLEDFLNYYLKNVYLIGKENIDNKGYDTNTVTMSDSPYLEKNIYDTGTGRYSNIFSFKYY